MRPAPQTAFSAATAFQRRKVSAGDERRSRAANATPASKQSLAGGQVRVTAEVMNLGMRNREVFPLPSLPIPLFQKTKSRRVRKRISLVIRALKFANSTIDTLNHLYSAPPLHTVSSVRAKDFSQSIFIKALAMFSQVSPSSATQPFSDDDGYASSFSTLTKISADLVSLPAIAGTFDTAKFCPPPLSDFLHAKSGALENTTVAQLASSVVRPCHQCNPGEYPRLLARMYNAGMLRFVPSNSQTSPRIVPPLGVFAVWKVTNEKQRLIVDARPANAFFTTPPYESTSGDNLATIVVPPGASLQVAKIDLADYFHCCALPLETQSFLRLPQVSPKVLKFDIWDVNWKSRPESVTPLLTTLPMGWSPSPAIAQAAHESLLYSGDHRLDPSMRLSAQRCPPFRDLWTGGLHSLVIDDLLLFRIEESDTSKSPAPQVPTLVAKYSTVGLTAKPEKVFDYSNTQELLGYQLRDNVFSISISRFHSILADFELIIHRKYARPREIERLVGKLTHCFLLNRPCLSVFRVVYIFTKKLGHRTARVWPQVLAELHRAISLLIVVGVDLSSAVSPTLIQTDASGSGTAAVYTDGVPLSSLQDECVKPRRVNKVIPDFSFSDDDMCDKEPYATQLESGFLSPTDPDVWKVAFRKTRKNDTRHINEAELAAVVDAIRWASRSKRFRGKRIVIESDSIVVVSILRKGRSSKPGLAALCRRLAALTLVNGLVIIPRWVPSNRNMADRPSRGFLRPGPCL